MPETFDPTLDPIVILESDNPMQLAMARGLLDDAGIPYYAQGQITRLVNDVDPFLRKWVRLQVPRDRELEAREVLEPVLHPETIPPDEEA